MKTYGNFSKGSNITSFQIGDNFIKIKYTDTSKVFTYSYKKAGQKNIDNMKLLASCGSGLNRYINTFAKHLFD